MYYFYHLLTKKSFYAFLLDEGGQYQVFIYFLPLYFDD